MSAIDSRADVLAPAPAPGGALPTVLVIGAMKCGTSALHDLLASHPEVSASEPKELNFFFGPPAVAGVTDADPGDGCRGTWHRRIDWYRSRFDPDRPVRLDSSPGYTSPDHPESAGRIAATLPGVRLVYLVRDPVERALSQYRHHWREGSERRDAGTALFDPASQYLARSRYLERLEPFVARFDRSSILVVAQEELAADPVAVLPRVLAFVGLDPGDARRLPASPRPLRPGECEGRVRGRLRDELTGDAVRFRRWCGREFPGWSA